MKNKDIESKHCKEDDVMVFLFYKQINSGTGESMRILDRAIILNLAILLFVIAIIILINIYYYVNGERHKINNGAHLGSVLLLLALVMQFIIESILIPSIEYYYAIARDIFLLMSCVAFVVTFLNPRYKTKKNLLVIRPNFSELFNEVDDSIVVFDHLGRVVRIYDKNNNLRFIKESLCHIDQLRRYLPKETADDTESTYSFEIISEDSAFAFQAVLSPVMKDGGRLIGHCAVLSDISVYHNLLRDLHEKNDVLKESNERLINEVEISEQFESEKHRLSLLTEIQKELIRSIDGTILRIDEIEKMSEQGITPQKEELSGLSLQLNSIYKNVRQVVRNILPVKEEK